MDVKDRKIIAELLVNSRISMTQLAKKVGVSREVATYRIKILEESGIIKGFNTIINYRALGFTRYVMYLQFQGVSAQEEENIINMLCLHDHITFLAPTIGRWNVVYDIFARDRVHLRSLISELEENIKPYLSRYIVNDPGDEEEIFSTKIVGIPKSMPLQTSQDHTIDATDKKILELLSDNARIEYAHLSKELDLSANAIKNRIKQLEQSNIIQQYTTMIDHTKLDFVLYSMHVQHKGRDTEKIKQFLREHSQVWFFYQYIGNEAYDLDIGLLAKDHVELRLFLIKIKELFGTQVSLYDLSISESIPKDNIAPKGLFV